MQIISAPFVAGKKVLLRADLDVPLECKVGSAECRVSEDFRLKAGLPTLKLCLENAAQVIIMGHLGRPGGKEVPELSVVPIYEWFKDNGFQKDLELGKLKLLENLRFENGESFDSAQDHGKVLEYAKELARFGDVFINEAFAAHHPAASTTVLPTLLPHAAGLRFAKEVEILTRVRENPMHPLTVIIGGIKIEDKLPAIEVLSKVADKILVGGKIAWQIKPRENILVGELNYEGTDITSQTLETWKEIILEAKQILWNGPLGAIEEVKNDATLKLARIIIESGADSIVGGGDTIGALGKWGLLDKFSFVSTGGGAMLEFLSKGTLPTIEALE